MAISQFCVAAQLALVAFLVVVNNVTAQFDSKQQDYWTSLSDQQHHRLRRKTSCNIQSLSAREPTYTYKSEAGVTQFWDSNSQDFECAGIGFLRHVVEAKGLVLPHYANTPQIIYIVEGRGILGTSFSGCPETYEYEGFAQEGDRSSRFTDSHQKLRRFKRGDVIALPAGITYWIYNDMDTNVVAVSLVDVANDANQLDLNYQKFFLAGNPQAAQLQGQGQGQQGRQRRRNILAGFDQNLLAQIYKVDPKIIQSMQQEDDQRGTIIRAERLRLVFPEWGSQEQERGGGESSMPSMNIIDGQSFCSANLKENIEDPKNADAYNPRGGRITSLNRNRLPILGFLDLSAERGILYKNGLVAPHYSMNAHTAVYVTGGRARIQVVGNEGNSVFDGEVKEGQLLVVPQNYVAIKKAGEVGFEYIALKTDGNAMKTHLAGRLSAIRGMPDEVLMNSYGISRDEAKALKYQRKEAAVFSPSFSSSRRPGLN